MFSVWKLQIPFPVASKTCSNGFSAFNIIEALLLVNLIPLHVFSAVSFKLSCKVSCHIRCCDVYILNNGRSDSPFLCIPISAMLGQVQAVHIVFIFLHCAIVGRYALLIRTTKLVVLLIIITILKKRGNFRATTTFSCQLHHLSRCIILREKEDFVSNRSLQHIFS